MTERFIQRTDIYARQLDDGSYVAIHKPFHDGLLHAHLRGEVTLGTYLLNVDSQGRHLVLDADNQPDWRRLTALSKALLEMGGVSYLEKSRRGGHLWLFHGGPVPGEGIRQFARGLLGHFRIHGIEVFPKQDRITNGPGSLIRLPFGVHRKNGRRYGFYKPNGDPLALSLREQITMLRTPQTLPEPIYERFWEYGADFTAERLLQPAGEPKHSDFESGDRSSLSERIKEAVSVRQFVLKYIELSPKGRGLCPFHNDTVESFSINNEGNFWHCFGCGKGGSIIDFYMHWNNLNTQTTIRQLATFIGLN